MAEFTAITSQEQLDSVIGDRLRRADEKWQKKFEGFISPEDFEKKTGELSGQVADLTKQLEEANAGKATFEQQIAERDKKIKAYEVGAIKHKVAQEMGLSYEAVGYLSGEDEESISKSAEGLKSLLGQSITPGFSNEPAVAASSRNAALKSMLKDLNK